MNPELEQIKSEIHNQNSAVFIVTTGRGRKKKAHILNRETGKSLCGRLGKKHKRIDSATAEKFYETCVYCEKNN